MGKPPYMRENEMDTMEAATNNDIPDELESVVELIRWARERGEPCGELEEHVADALLRHHIEHSLPAIMVDDGYTSMHQMESEMLSIPPRGVSGGQIVKVAELEILRNEIDKLEEMLLARVRRDGLGLPFRMKITLEYPDGNDVVASGSWRSWKMIDDGGT